VDFGGAQGDEFRRGAAGLREAEQLVGAFAGSAALPDQGLAREHPGDLGALVGGAPDALKGEQAGQFSIRVNDQFRICFAWTPAGPEHVEITDYH